LIVFLADVVCHKLEPIVLSSATSRSLHWLCRAISADFKARHRFSHIIQEVYARCISNCIVLAAGVKTNFAAAHRGKQDTYLLIKPRHFSARYVSL
jgi:hypothetical protein